MAAPVVALAIALLGTPLAARLFARLGVIDRPGPRSSHVEPTPRGGGLAPAIAVVAGLALSTQFTGAPRTGLLLVACGVGLFGLIDDVRELSPGVRLLGQLFFAGAALSSLLAGLTGPALWRGLFTVGVLLWLVSFVNAFNFMDGIDGLATAQIVVAGLAWAVVGAVKDVDLLVAGGLVLAAAGAGFAPFNLLRTTVFMGDVGSYFFGGALAAMAVIGVRAGMPPEAMVAPLAVFLTDTGTTLCQRLLRRAAWAEAHREHRYQQLVELGFSHRQTTAGLALVMAVCSALGWASLSEPTAIRIAADVGLAAVLVAYATLPRFLDGRGKAAATAAPARHNTTKSVATTPS